MEQEKNDLELIEEYYRTRDPKLRETVILHFTPLVHFILGRLGISRSITNDYEDLQSQGIMGLIEAVDHYKPEFGTKLSTYASFKIRGRVLDYLRGLDWLSRSARQKVKSVQEAVNVMEKDLHRLPSDGELASHLQIGIDTLQQIQQDSSYIIVSLDIEYNTEQEDGPGSFHERLADYKQVNPSQTVEKNEIQTILSQCLKDLPEREQLVLSLYYFDEMTFKEIGKTLDISESRVCQIHGRAMSNLKTILRANDVT